MNKKLEMLKRWTVGLTSVFFISGTAPFSAQQTVSLQDAINQALSNKAEAKKASAEIRRAELKIDEAKAGALPQISAQGSINYNPIIQQSLLVFDGQSLIAEMGQKWTSGITATVNQALFDQRVFTGLKAAKSTREFYVLNAELTNEQIIENVATAYYQVFVQEENLRTLEASYDNTEKVRDIIKSLVDNGLAKPIDLDRTNVQLTNIGSSRQQLVNAVELSKNALKFYMGVPITQQITLVETDIDPRPEMLLSDVNLEERSELKVLAKQRELLEFNKEATEAYLYPTVGLSASYGWAGMGNKFPLTHGLKDNVLWSDAMAIGLNINIPIFSGGATRSKIEQTKIDIENLETDIADTKLALSLDHQNAISNIENSLINLENMKENVSLAERVHENTQSNYQYGLANLTELLDAQNALTDAKQNYATALLDYKLAEIKLIKAKGQLKNLQTP